MTPAQSNLIWHTIRRYLDENRMYGFGGYASTEQCGNVTTFLVFDAGHGVAKNIYNHLRDDMRICKFDYYYKEEW